jgi:hypothetical protein
MVHSKPHECITRYTVDLYSRYATPRVWPVLLNSSVRFLCMIEGANWLVKVALNPSLLFGLTVRDVRTSYNANLQQTQ